MRSGLLIEFETPDGLRSGIERLRKLGPEHGIDEMEAYTPWPVKGVDELLKLPKSKVPRNVLIGGLCGAATGYLVQWYCNAINFPIDIGGRPPHSAPAFVLITFETMVLFAGVTSFLSALVFAGLPRLWDPVFEVEGFRRASIDRFWLGLKRGRAPLDVDAIRREMASLGALQVVAVGEDQA